MAGKGKKPDIDYERLCEAIYHDRRDLEHFRVERKDAVRTYVGGHWSADGSPQKVPLNLLSLYTQIVGRSLVPKEPRALMSTFNRKHKPAVSAMESWANREIVKMGLRDTLQRVVVDSLFSIGIMKVALVDPEHSSLWAWDIPAGTPYAERVDLDDFVFDTHARDFREASYIGHRYRVPLASVKDNKRFKPKVREHLHESEDSPYNREGDERVTGMQRTTKTSVEFEAMVDLWEIYLPRHRVICVIPDDQVNGAASHEGGAFDDSVLEVKDWVGPPCGPYHFLSFGVVPGNAMPKSPLQDLIDLHTVTNELYLKLMRQGERQKDILTVQGQADEDGNRIMQANDGDIIRLDNPDRTKIASFGGPNQNNLQLAIHLKDVFSYMAGNLDAMGGLSPQAKTLGQDRMLAESASRTVADMQETTACFVSKALGALGWYWWHDPFRVMRTEHTVLGLPESSITREVYPMPREGQRQPGKLYRDGSWDELELKVDPYSLQYQTPSQRLQAIMGLFERIVAPMAALLQQQGIVPDMSKLLQIIAKYGDLPEIVDILTVQEPPAQPQPGGGGGEEPGMPAHTSREYTRHSSSGGAAGRENELMSMAAGGEGSGMFDPEGG